MSELTLTEYSEVVAAAFALTTGWERKDQERIDRALKRLRNVLAPDAPNAAVPVGAGLTRRQRDALAFIEAHQAEKGIPPSYDEIATGIGLRSRSGIHRLIGELVARDRISMRPYAPRSIVVTVPLRDVEKGR